MLNFIYRYPVDINNYEDMLSPEVEELFKGKPHTCFYHDAFDFTGLS